MSKAIENLYKKGTVNVKRVNTDKLFINENSKNEFTGHLDKAIRYIEEFQLLNAEDWARFVEQFRAHTDTDSGWRGEYWGKMMRGAAFTYSYTKNPALYKALCDTVNDMISVIEEDGRVSTYTRDEEFTGWDMWSRKYVLLGMQYFMEICTDVQLNARIVDFMVKQTDYIIAHIGDEEGKRNITQTTNCWRGINSSSILEPVARLYSLTGEKRFLDFAEYIVTTGGCELFNLFELAYEDTTDPYQYPVVKAYETISCFEGLLEYYRVTGIEKWKTAVINFARRLAKTDITIIGTAGTVHELLDHSAVRQTEPALQEIMQETCVTVTWMKFVMQLLLITGESEFADYYEQSLYNVYLGAINTEKVVDEHVLKQYPNAVLVPLPFDSYSSLIPNTRGRGIGGLKVMPDNHYYGCCACIGSAGIGIMHKISTLVKDEGVSVNLFINGVTETVTPENNPLTLTFDTEYPKDGMVNITVGVEKEEEFAVDIRIPAWSKATRLSVNGQSVAVTDGYTSVKRIWKNGDRITLVLDMRTKVMLPVRYDKDVVMVDVNWCLQYYKPVVVHQSEESMYHIAMRRGPIVLARDARLDGTVDEAVDILYDEEGYVNVTESNKAGFDTLVEYQVPLINGKTFTAIDYSSAGKTWRDDSRYACWLPTKEYWRK